MRRETGLLRLRIMLLKIQASEGKSSKIIPPGWGREWTAWPWHFIGKGVSRMLASRINYTSLGRPTNWLPVIVDKVLTNNTVSMSSNMVYGKTGTQRSEVALSIQKWLEFTSDILQRSLRVKWACWHCTIPVRCLAPSQVPYISGSYCHFSSWYSFPRLEK